MPLLNVLELSKSMYTVEYLEECQTDLDRVGPVIADRVLRCVETTILRDPVKAGISLAGSVPGGRYVAVFSTHIIYTVDEVNKRVTVIGIRPEGAGVA